MYSSIPSKAEIEKNFTYHRVWGSQPYRYESLRKTAKDLAIAIDAQCPPSRERSLALTKVEEAIMWANAAIARNESQDNEDCGCQRGKVTEAEKGGESCTTQ